MIIDPESAVAGVSGHDYGLRRIRSHAVDPSGACGVEPHFIAESRYEYGGGGIGFVGEIAYLGCVEQYAAAAATFAVIYIFRRDAVDTGSRSGLDYGCGCCRIHSRTVVDVAQCGSVAHQALEAAVGEMILQQVEIVLIESLHHYAYNHLRPLGSGLGAG